MKNNLNAFLTRREYRTDRSELSQFPKFQRNSESLTFNLILNTDGVSPQQCSRANFWTVSLAVVELDRFHRGQHRNMGLSAIISGSSKPPYEAWAFVVEKLADEIQEMREIGIVVDDKTFYLSSINGCVDLEVSGYLISLIYLSIQLLKTTFSVLKSGMYTVFSNVDIHSL